MVGVTVRRCVGKALFAVRADLRENRRKSWTTRNYLDWLIGRDRAARCTATHILLVLIVLQQWAPTVKKHYVDKDRLRSARTIRKLG